MISKINICSTATFGNASQSLDDLRKFNYFFGANGTGKTTISKILADESQFPNCSVTWENNLGMETRVYNRDFVDRNFSPLSKLKGVFTLGKQEADTLQKIETIKQEIDSLTDNIKTFTNTIQGEDGNGGKKNELTLLEEKFRDKFWVQKQKHDTKLSGGFEGVRKSKDSFKTKVLNESINNAAVLLPIRELEERAVKIFANTPTIAQNLTIPQADRLLTHEQNSILKKRVIGKDDVDIAAIIKKLGNSDWVRQGLSYYDANDGVCPFCQQKTDESFAKSLSEYFDESFEKDNAVINSLLTDYSTDAIRFQQQIQGIIDAATEFLDMEKLKGEKQILDSLISVNNQRLEQKKKEASQVIVLDSLKNVLDEITLLLTSANKQINEHNAIVRNLSNERRTLTSQIWKFIVVELKIDIADYRQKKVNFETAINNLSTQIVAKQKIKSEKMGELRGLEKQTTSIQPTIDGINKLLSSFGFKSFGLAKGDDGKTYKLIRANGAEAQTTLSEGEKNFVTFLYFYHLLKGSQTESGMTADKVVVFDDPVSSLDSDVLFIVSSLIRELFSGLRENKETIKQVFVLTHNIYFHKEITYNNSRNKNGTLNDETFWLIKKQGNNSVVEKQTNNPIKTSYELLWDEVRKENRNNVTIQNTLRRILENYFKLLGGIPLDGLYKKFDGDDKAKCKALCSWVNDGSHSVFDDDYCTTIDGASVNRYLQVFQQIFEKCNQISHYNMMMGISPEQVATVEE